MQVPQGGFKVVVSQQFLFIGYTTRFVQQMSGSYGVDCRPDARCYACPTLVI